MSVLAQFRAMDPVLARALAMAYRWSPQWRSVAAQAAQRQPSINWANLPTGVWGLYTSRPAAIRVSTALRAEDIEVVAAVLAHEIHHAATNVLGKLIDLHRSADCMQDEIDSFSWEAAVWTAFPAAPPRSEAERWLDTELVPRWQAQKLHEFVPSSPAYETQCLGRELTG